MLSRLKSFNWFSFLAMLALVAVGTVAIWSAGSAREGAVFHAMWIANLQTAGLGLVLYFTLAFTDYRRILDFGTLPAYLGAVVLLVAVLLVGAEVYGGKRWLWFFQPSEISKLCILMALAQAYGRLQYEFRGRAYHFGGFVGFLAAIPLVGIPCLLILMEPDLGTTLSLVPAVIVLMFAAGVWRTGLTALLAIGGLSATLLLGAVYEAEKPGVPEARRAEIQRYVVRDRERPHFLLAPLKPHQYKRVKTFLFPKEDRKGAGWNEEQALISIGTGGWSGKGLRQGENNRLKFLPASVSMNDFIFCVYAEETGYRGSLLLLGLYLTLTLSGVWTAWRATDVRGRLLALSVTTLIFAHVFINIGMSIGLLPITGLPLPFISSGRTFLVVVMSGVGLIQSVALHREEIT